MNEDNDILDESIEEEESGFLKKLFAKDSFLDRLNKKIKITPFLLIFPPLIISLILGLYGVSKRNDFTAIVAPEFMIALFFLVLIFAVDRILAHLASQKVVVALELGLLLLIFIGICSIL